MNIYNFPQGIKYVPAEHPKKREWYRLVRDYHLKYDDIDVIIPRGFEWDGATIPRIAWSIIGYHSMGKMAEPSLIHDYIYVFKGLIPGQRKISRKECDKLFREHLIAVGVPKRAANRIYRIVRIFGVKYWRDL
jgi:hypothetical protein